jgi:hypothetical protein
MIPVTAKRIKKRLLLAAVAGSLAIMALASLGSDAQEKGAQIFPTAPGLVPQFGGFVRLGNPETRLQKGGPSSSPTSSTNLGRE